MRIGRDLIKPCPMRQSIGCFDQWHPLDRGFEINQFELLIHVLIETRQFIRIAHSNQQSIAVAMNVKRLSKVNYKRKIMWKLGQGSGGENLSADGLDWKVDSSELSDLS